MPGQQRMTARVCCQKRDLLQISSASGGYPRPPCTFHSTIEISLTGRCHGRLQACLRHFPGSARGGSAGAARPLRAFFPDPGAGSGKPILLARRQAGDTRRTVAYYPLQARDNEPVRFFRRLAKTSRGRVEGFDISWLNPFGAEPHQSPEVLGDCLTDALERIAGGLYSVFDDFQHISRPIICVTAACAARSSSASMATSVTRCRSAVLAPARRPRPGPAACPA